MTSAASKTTSATGTGVEAISDGDRDMPFSPEIYRGVTFGFWARNGYFESPQARLEVDRMAETGVRWVCVVPTIMQETITTPRMFADFEVTPGEFELAEIIDYIHGRGMKVKLRPMIEGWDGHGRTMIWFPYDRPRIPGLATTHYANWFRSMRARTRFYARLAKRTGCEMYGIDSEIDRFVSFNKEWREVVETARSVYDGPVTSCHTHEVNFIKELERPDHWFRDLDCLGTSFYKRSALEHGADMATRLKMLEPVRQEYRQIARLLGRPIMFGEIGCTSSTGGSTRPSGWSGDGKYEPQEQSDHIDAVLQTFWDEPWFAGLFWWKWDEQNVRPAFINDPAGDKGFTVWGKPAAAVMKRWFDRPERAGTGR